MKSTIQSMTTGLWVLVAAGLLFGTAAPAETNVKAQAEKLQAKIYELLDKDITTVNFKKGSSNLSNAEISSLKSLVTAAKKNGVVEEFVVAAWSDQEYPTAPDQKLTVKQRDLADKRNDQIKNVLKEADSGTVSTYSMAERPSWIAKTFNTEDAQVKGAGKNSSADDQAEIHIGKRLRDKGGPSKAVVVVKYKEITAAR